MSQPTVTLYGPRIKVMGHIDGSVRLLCDEFDETTRKSSIVTIDLTLSRGREWTLLMRGWLELPGRDALTMVALGRDAKHRNREAKIEITFPRGQVLELLPELEAVLQVTPQN